MAYGEVLLTRLVQNRPQCSAALAFCDANVQQLKHAIVVSQSATVLPEDGSPADCSLIQAT